MKDLANRINPVPAIAPQVQTNSDAAIVGAIIDHLGALGVTYVINVGNVTDPDVTSVVLLEHGDDLALADAAAVPDEQLAGTELLAAFTFANDNVARKLGYLGLKRYSRITITPTGNNAGSIPISATCLLSHLEHEPAQNPPVNPLGT